MAQSAKESIARNQRKEREEKTRGKRNGRVIVLEGIVIMVLHAKS